MRQFAAAIVGAALCAAPALAQTTAPAAPETGTTPSPMQPVPGTAPAAAPTANGGSMAASQDRVRAALGSAGYTDVLILDTAYVVQARTPEGETVTMIIESGAAGTLGSVTPGAPTSIDSVLGEDEGTANDLGAPAEGAAPTTPPAAPGTPAPAN